MVDDQPFDDQPFDDQPIDDQPFDDGLADSDRGHDPDSTMGRRRIQQLRRRGPLLLGGLLAVATVLIGVAVLRHEDAAPPLPDLPPGAVRVDAWAPYWTLSDTLPETQERFSDLREISPFWYSAVSVNRIVIDEHAPFDDADEFIELIRDANRKFVPSIRDAMPAGAMAAVLANPVTRAAHVDAVVEFAADNDVDGIDLDYEQFAFADGPDTWEATSPNWVLFVTELAQRLHADGRTITVSIPAVFDVETTGRRGYWVYDHGAIAAVVDAIRIMAYDYSTSEAGPIAPLSWVQEAVDGTALAVAPEFHHKLVLGIPSYGSNWVTGTVGICPDTAEGRTNITARTALELADRRDGVPVYDEVLGEWSFSYSLEVTEGAVSCIQSRMARWVDAEGAAERVEIARRAGWGGVALWALGYEDADVWSAIVTASNAPLAPSLPDGEARGSVGMAPPNSRNVATIA
ncbi:MAG TPA: glycosyl hydrolase family 18 protein [Ilumatobacter sp.]|nr:glycosyl hydrolase family 18 protein [Ilumatobacter sp.]